MIYQGNAITVKALEQGVAQLTFDLQGSSVNKLDQQSLDELRDALNVIAADDNIKGLVLCSDKSAFIVGADIMEFVDMFKLPDEELIVWCGEANKIFNTLEDLAMPTVCAINGMALGGGLEVCLATDYRIAEPKAVLGLPEVKLGICPGFGGTVRLPRLIGADNAIEWIASAKHKKAEEALSCGVVDAIVSEDLLLQACVDLIQQCLGRGLGRGLGEGIDGRLNYLAVREQKKAPLKLNQIESLVTFQTAKGLVAGMAGPHYPAPLAVVKSMAKAASLGRDAALKIEHEVFVTLAKSEVAANLVLLFLNDQFLNKKAKSVQADAKPVRRAAVMGAGIMGGGIAYQSALKGTPIVMKDIAQEGLELGMAEAKRLLLKRLAKGRIDANKMGDVLSNIHPTLHYADFDTVDFVVEAVVENMKVKQTVLSEVEQLIPENAILASNTSTISITKLAESLQRPESFCGMHFFNPVPLMPLVEVIKGEKTADDTVATTVAYAKSIGKTPIVVNDCPGFLVNRILFPYFGAFAQLLRDGVNFVKVDKVMEKFGWPMGPAYLLDVVGIDTAVHAQRVMGEGFPDRMQADFKTATDLLFELKRYGQKSGCGFYHYEEDKKGRKQKVLKEEIYATLKPVQKENADLSDEEILERMMVSLCLEAVRCLEDGIVSSPTEVDMGLILGLGFPAFRGGALRYIDAMGLGRFCATADKYTALGAMYQVTDKLRDMANSQGKQFYLQSA